ncbi:hypothetical protein EsH8_XII_000019 [Colletotrichum jinshuiense]
MVRDGNALEKWRELIILQVSRSGRLALSLKARQVAIMSRIYSNCTAVIAWFCIEDADAATVFQLLAALDMSNNDFGARVRLARRGGGPGVVLENLYTELDMVPLPLEVVMRASFRKRVACDVAVSVRRYGHEDAKNIISPVSAFIRGPRKLLFEYRPQLREVVTDGVWGQERDYTKHTPLTTWNISVAEHTAKNTDGDAEPSPALD